MKKIVIGLAIAFVLMAGCKEKEKTDFKESEPRESSAEIQQLAEDLKDQRQQIRLSSVLALEKRNDNSAVPLLLEALKDEDVAIRAYPPVALGKTYDPSVIGPLIESLKAEGQIDYGAVDEALIRIGRPAAAAMMDALKDKHWRVVSTAVRVLGEIGEEPAVEPLIQILRNKEPSPDFPYDTTFFLRFNAAESLGKLVDDRALIALIEALSDDEARAHDQKPWVRKAAEEALKGIPDRRYRLVENKYLAAWGTNGTYKILKDTPFPRETKEKISVEVAGNEYEPFQVLLKAKTDIDRIEIQIFNLKKEGGQELSREHIEVLLEGYVSVRVASDILGTTDFWPDPLCLIRNPSV